MKIVIIFLSIFLLAACASSSDVKNIEQLVTDGQSTINELDSKIKLLEDDRSKLAAQLNTISSSGQSMKTEAANLKEKITIIDQSISSYQKEIKTISSTIKTNSDTIAVVNKQQVTQHKAAVKAVNANEQLKLQAVDEILALELEYEAKRKKAAEENNEENQGGN